MARKQAAKTGEGTRQIQNRRARFDYEIVESMEAGIELLGAEVKSIYLGRANLGDAYCRIVNNELMLINCDIEPYEFASAYKPERRRDRKLLMHRKEINTLNRKSMEKGFAIIPLKIYFARGKVKVEIALGRGKAHYDKRESIAKKDERREMERIRGKREI